MDGLDVARGLFLAHGALWVVIGALTPLMRDSNVGTRTLIFSGPSDTRAFGVTPDELLRDRRVLLLRGVLLDIVGGLLLAAGALVLATAWFGLGANERWAMAALTTIAIAAPLFWWKAARPYREAGTRIGLGDLPPFMWVPVVLDLPAIVLGWVDLLG